MHVLATGASGYIGGRLVPRLLRAGHTVRVLTRDPKRLAGRFWADRVEVVRGDLLDPSSIAGICNGIDAAYYLVHSMSAGIGYVTRDCVAAEGFCRVATDLRHLIYVGGLLPRGIGVSRHLRSRAEIGGILARHMPVTEFRAGPIIGSGSASFEMIRYLTERLPLIVAPHWIRNEVQPIAIRDVLSYLVGALERGPSGIVDIGSDPLTFAEMMYEYARIRRLRRLIVSVPGIIPPAVGARWVGLATPIPRPIVAALLEGMAKPPLVSSPRAHELFPTIKPISYRKATLLALRRVRQQAVETRWSGAQSEASTYEFRDYQGLVREVRTLHVHARPETVFRVFSGLGGERGWLVWKWAWWARGTLDRLLGGPGIGRGRRDPDELLPGEALDFWRVELVRPPRLLRLRAEAKLPGRGWLQWETKAEGEGTRLTQTASFSPEGLPGTLYWYLLYPFHRMIFTDLIQAIGKQALAASPSMTRVGRPRGDFPRQDTAASRASGTPSPRRGSRTPARPERRRPG